jgi:hypothetical protein
MLGEVFFTSPSLGVKFFLQLQQLKIGSMFLMWAKVNPASAGLRQ